MDFAIPGYGWFALPIVALLLAASARQGPRERALRRFAEPHLLRRLLPVEGRWQRAAWLLPYLGMLLLMLALMRPQAGMDEGERLSAGLNIVVAIDVSKSMLADDLPPTRLTVAKQAVGALADELGGDRLGLIAFAGSAFQLCPLTGDHAIVRQLLAELDPEMLPRGGSSIAAALAEAQRAFRGVPPEGRVLLLLSDGEDHGGGVAAAMEELRSQGITVCAALVGTEAGGVMPLPDGRFVTDQTGLVVKSRASLATLRQVDPAVVPLAGDGSGLAGLLQRARLAATETAGVERHLKPAERYQLPLALALLCWGAGLMLPRRPRP